MSNEIKCITKNDRYAPYEKITHIGGVNANGTNWKITQAEAIDGIESGKWRFHVSRFGHTVKVIVAKSRFGNKYVKTESDGDTPDNLLSLPSCVN